MYVARARCESQLTVGWMLPDYRDGLSSSSFLVWSSIAQWVCQGAFSLLAIWCLGSRVQILLSAEEHNLSPFDLNIACLCQSIEINNNKYVCMYVCGVKWAECSLIIGTGCRVQVFLAWSSIAQSVCQRAFSLLAIWCLGPRLQILHSAEEHNLSPFDLNIACLCQGIEINNNKYVCMYVCMYACMQICIWKKQTINFPLYGTILPTSGVSILFSAQYFPNTNYNIWYTTICLYKYQTDFQFHSCVIWFVAGGTILIHTKWHCPWHEQRYVHALCPLW